MAYCTVTDLEQAAGGPDRLVQIADWNKDGIADADRMALAISGADAMIDAYCNKQYLVPMSPVPPLIRDLSARIAIWRMRQPSNTIDPDTHGACAKDDLDMLKAIKDGEISLGVEPVPQASSMRVDAYTPAGTSRERSRAKLGGFS